MFSRKKDNSQSLENQRDALRETIDSNKKQVKKIKGYIEYLTVFIYFLYNNDLLTNVRKNLKNLTDPEGKHATVENAIDSLPLSKENKKRLKEYEKQNNTWLWLRRLFIYDPCNELLKCMETQKAAYEAKVEKLANRENRKLQHLKEINDTICKRKNGQEALLKSLKTVLKIKEQQLEKNSRYQELYLIKNKLENSNQTYTKEEIDKQISDVREILSRHVVTTGITGFFNRYRRTNSCKQFDNAFACQYQAKFRF